MFQALWWLIYKIALISPGLSLSMQHEHFCHKVVPVLDTLSHMLDTDTSWTLGHFLNMHSVTYYIFKLRRLVAHFFGKCCIFLMHFFPSVTCLRYLSTIMFISYTVVEKWRQKLDFVYKYNCLDMFWYKKWDALSYSKVEEPRASLFAKSSM